MPTKLNLNKVSGLSWHASAPSWWCTLGIVLTAHLLPYHSAQAFICGRTVAGSNNGVGSGASTYWQERELTFFLNEESIGPIDVNTLGSIEQVRATLQKAGETWSNLRRRANETIDCSGRLQSQAKGIGQTDIQIQLGGNTQQRYVGYNYLIPESNQNIFVFRPNNWYPDEDKQGILGLTTTSYNPYTGRILDADIEFNSQGHTFYSEDLLPSNPQGLGSNVDLLYVASHELGHAIGFSHSNDSNALMFANAPVGNNFFSKRDLSCDDLVMVLFRYPNALPTGYCAQDNVDADCGYCALPRRLDYLALIKTLRSDGGGGAFGCQQMPGSHWLLLAGLSMYRYCRRRQRGLLATNPSTAA